MHEIQCDTPVGFKSNTTLSLALMANEKFLFTNFNYTFLDTEYFKQGLPGINHMDKKPAKVADKLLSAFADVFRTVKARFF